MNYTNKTIRERVGDDWYEYIPLGKYIVTAQGVCGGRPTFKYTRLEVGVVLDLLASGLTVKDVLHEYSQSNLSTDAIGEAILLAKKALLDSSKTARSAA